MIAIMIFISPTPRHLTLRSFYFFYLEQVDPFVINTKFFPNSLYIRRGSIIQYKQISYWTYINCVNIYREYKLNR